MNLAKAVYENTDTRQPTKSAPMCRHHKTRTVRVYTKLDRTILEQKMCESCAKRTARRWRGFRVKEVLL